MCGARRAGNGRGAAQDPFSDVESDEDSEIEMLECAEDAEMDEDEDDDDDEAGAAGGRKAQQVWIPGKGGDQPEHLEVDNSTYEMLHRMNVEWPMLSFDFVADNLGAQRTRFPMTAYAAGGTQADVPEKNKIFLMKMHSLHRTKHDDGSGSDSDESQEGEEDLDDDPELDHVSVPHHGAVNRLRVMPQQVFPTPSRPCCHEPRRATAWSEHTHTRTHTHTHTHTHAHTHTRMCMHARWRPRPC